MGVREIRAKGILQRSRLPGAEYVINPYTGCVHGCVYCYARFMMRFTDHPEPWGAFLDAKINGPELLDRELSRRRTAPAGGVLLSSVTDPYQPPERKFALTRGILETLVRHGVHFSILTKSDLVLRDLDLFAESAGAAVGLSLGVSDDDWGARLEPRAAPPSRRIAALRTLRAHKVETWAFVSPFLPGVSDIGRTVAALAGAVDCFSVEAINTGAGSWAATLAAIAAQDPELARTCARLARDPAYWRDLESRARTAGARAGLKLDGFFHHPSLRSGQAAG